MTVYKTFGPARVKQMDDEGRGVAIIATTNVIDKDGDVTQPGAFGEQTAQVVPSHNWQHVPLGKARIREEGDQALADFQLNLDIQAARDWHSALKFDLASGDALQEWSYGFSVKADDHGEFDGQRVRFLKSVDVHEISPVLLGAGEGTRTVAVKSENKRGSPLHDTKASKAAWDGPANERKLPSTMDRETANAAYGWVASESGDEIKKDDARFLHHFVDEQGTPGEASVKAAITGIAVLNGARGGTTIPDADRKAVHRHLAKHLEDAGEDVPELRSYDECSMKLVDQIRFATWDAEAAVERAKGVQSMRKAEGRALSEDRIEDLTGLCKALDELHATAKSLEQLIDNGERGPDVANLLGEYHAISAKLRGHLPKN